MSYPKPCLFISANSTTTRRTTTVTASRGTTSTTKNRNSFAICLINTQRTSSLNTHTHTHIERETLPKFHIRPVRPRFRHFASTETSHSSSHKQSQINMLIKRQTARLASPRLAQKIQVKIFDPIIDTTQCRITPKKRRECRREHTQTEAPHSTKVLLLHFLKKN